MPDDLRRRYVRVLLDRLRDTRYPSAPMLDRIEEAIADRDTAAEYIGELMSQLERDRYPSPTTMARVNRLLTYL